jgi:hypothetical protein
MPRVSGSVVSVALHRPVRQSKLTVEKFDTWLGLASSLGSCELVTDSSDGEAVKVILSASPTRPSA